MAFILIWHVETGTGLKGGGLPCSCPTSRTPTLLKSLLHPWVCVCVCKLHLTVYLQPQYTVYGDKEDKHAMK